MQQASSTADFEALPVALNQKSRQSVEFCRDCASVCGEKGFFRVKLDNAVQLTRRFCKYQVRKALRALCHNIRDCTYRARYSLQKGREKAIAPPYFSIWNKNPHKNVEKWFCAVRFYENMQIKYPQSSPSREYRAFSNNINTFCICESAAHHRAPNSRNDGFL